MEITRVFIHGLESSGQGTKGVFFRQRYPDMIIEDFDGPFEKRMEKLETLLASKDNLVLVGSSYGGLMAAAYACRHEQRVKRLVLLAPALHLEACRPFLNRHLQVPVIIFHGRQDEVVPLEPVRSVAGQIFADCRFNEVDDDYSLHATFESFDWDTLVG